MRYTARGEYVDPYPQADPPSYPDTVTMEVETTASVELLGKPYEVLLPGSGIFILVPNAAPIFFTEYVSAHTPGETFIRDEWTPGGS